MAATKKHEAIDRPFLPAVLDEAGRLAARYHIVLEEIEEGGFGGTVLELPTVIAEGRDAAECFEATRRATQTAIACMIENGQKPPQPRVRERRDEQLNLRLSMDEKRLLEYAAGEHSYKSVSDFVREVALQAARTPVHVG